MSAVARSKPACGLSAGWQPGVAHRCRINVSAAVTIVLVLVPVLVRVLVVVHAGWPGVPQGTVAKRSMSSSRPGQPSSTATLKGATHDHANARKVPR